MERDFDVHVVVELYFSELKASHCRKVVPLTFLILPRVDHLRRYLIYVLLLSDEAMTIQHTGNKNTKPLNVSPSLTTGLPSTDIARLKSERLRDHGEEGTNAVSYEPAADKTRHQGETLR
ncbi:hypothetical protein YC2023_061880 [Brassica napus]